MGSDTQEAVAAVTIQTASDSEGVEAMRLPYHLPYLMLYLLLYLLQVVCDVGYVRCRSCMLQTVCAAAVCVVLDSSPSPLTIVLTALGEDFHSRCDGSSFDNFPLVLLVAGDNPEGASRSLLPFRSAKA